MTHSGTFWNHLGPLSAPNTPSEVESDPRMGPKRTRTRCTKGGRSFATVLPPLWRILVRFGTHCGAFWSALWYVLERIEARFGAHFGAFWNHLGPLSAPNTPSSVESDPQNGPQNAPERAVRRGDAPLPVAVIGWIIPRYLIKLLTHF